MDKEQLRRNATSMYMLRLTNGIYKLRILDRIEDLKIHYHFPLFFPFDRL